MGSVEGEIGIVNSQNGKIVANFSGKKRQTNEDEEEMESGSNSIESLIFSKPESNHLLSADVDGNFTGKISRFLIQNSSIRSYTIAILYSLVILC